jgi:hypothetical protein
MLNIIYLNQTLILEIFLFIVDFFNIHIIQQTQLSMIHMPLKWHHIDKYSNNCKKVDILTSILVRLSSYAPLSIFLSL